MLIMSCTTVMAQTFTDHVRKDGNGKATVTITQSADVEKLVNSRPALTEKQKIAEQQAEAARAAKEAKENIKASELNALDLINGINIVDYTYKMDPKAIPHIGFIAENTDSLLSTPKKNRMDYTNCIGVLLKAVQELSKKVAALEARV